MIGLLAILISYLIGGIPFGMILYRAVHGGDIRGVGSGNIGATNVMRAGGRGIGIATLALDAAKGAAAVYLGLAATGEASWGAAAAMAAVLGHCFPVALGFRGGKGVATGAGAFLVLDPLAMGVALALFALTLGATRMVSAGSVAGALGFPLASALLGGATPMALWSAGSAAVILIRHRDNLERILHGTERRLGGSRAGEAKGR